MRGSRKCTACGEQPDADDTHRHPLLNVLICGACKDKYHSGTFSVGRDGHENFCRWCGDGGELVLCETCPRGICRACVERNFGKRELNRLLNDDGTVWSCYICDPLPIVKRSLYYEPPRESRVVSDKKQHKESDKGKKRKREDVTSDDEDGEVDNEEDSDGATVAIGEEEEEEEDEDEGIAGKQHNRRRKKQKTTERTADRKKMINEINKKHSKQGLKKQTTKHDMKKPLKTVSKATTKRTQVQTHKEESENGEQEEEETGGTGGGNGKRQRKKKLVRVTRRIKLKTVKMYIEEEQEEKQTKGRKKQTTTTTTKKHKLLMNKKLNRPYELDEQNKPFERKVVFLRYTRLKQDRYRPKEEKQRLVRAAMKAAERERRKREIMRKIFLKRREKELGKPDTEINTVPKRSPKKRLEVISCIESDMKPKRIRFTPNARFEVHTDEEEDEEEEDIESLFIERLAPPMALVFCQPFDSVESSQPSPSPAGSMQNTQLATADPGLSVLCGCIEGGGYVCEEHRSDNYEYVDCQAIPEQKGYQYVESKPVPDNMDTFQDRQPFNGYVTSTLAVPYTPPRSTDVFTVSALPASPAASTAPTLPLFSSSVSAVPYNSIPSDTSSVRENFEFRVVVANSTDAKRCIEMRLPIPDQLKVQ